MVRAALITGITGQDGAFAAGQQDVLYLGNLDARRDWGRARNYAEGMQRIVRHEVPGAPASASPNWCGK
ncbi:MAG TPA: GDP-mannose 4,6-dehydratase [Azospirillaceae bacterium]|nr:GDP-mannose 4,6-dehydratase [Azospirillaceae bacterium]